MCNLYSITTNQAAIAGLFRRMNRYVGNLAPMPGVFPDYPAPVIRNVDGAEEMVLMRWGMPPPPKTGGPPVTNIRNTSSPHWRGWLNAGREDILAAMQIETIEEAENVLDALDQGSLEAELIDQKARYEDQDDRTRDLFAAKNKAEDRIAAVGGDGSVAAIDAKRRTTLLTIEDKAVAYLKLRLGAAAADNALRAYRDRHRSSMMARASESFALISRGAYSKLVTQSSGGSEILIANGADGSSKIASELSKGTRFQLYLALRVAGYHEFARAHAPPPFLADDIMETFDDFRAEEAFRLLAGMAGAGQVVYFTHHRHLCEIAKSVEPTVTIHTREARRRLNARRRRRRPPHTSRPTRRTWHRPIEIASTKWATAERSAAW
jgi:hypothetical protein